MAKQLLALITLLLITTIVSARQEKPWRNRLEFRDEYEANTPKGAWMNERRIPWKNLLKRRDEYGLEGLVRSSKDYLTFPSPNKGRPCDAAVEEVLNEPVAKFKPNCKPNGLYEEKQCDGVIGACWCVFPQNGTEVPGTWTRFTILAPSLGVVCGRPCDVEVAEAGNGSISKFKPMCKPNGFYQEKQCDPSVGFCWCVFPQNGTKVPGTRTKIGEGQDKEFTCDRPCDVKVVEMGNDATDKFIPNCKSNGFYQDKQCDPTVGFCWCVFWQNGTKVPHTWATTMPEPEPGLTCGLKGSSGPSVDNTKKEMHLVRSDTDTDEGW